MNAVDRTWMEPARDVLAAEEFVLPAPDPLLTPERLELPTDLVGGELRDVLVAEEFAIPAPDEAHEPPRAPERPGSFPTDRIVGAALLLTLKLFGLWAWRRRRRRQAA